MTCAPRGTHCHFLEGGGSVHALTSAAVLGSSDSAGTQSRACPVAAMQSHPGQHRSLAPFRCHTALWPRDLQHGACKLSAQGPPGPEPKDWGTGRDGTMTAQTAAALPWWGTLLTGCVPDPPPRQSRAPLPFSAGVPGSVTVLRMNRPLGRSPAEASLEWLELHKSHCSAPTHFSAPCARELPNGCCPGLGSA